MVWQNAILLLALSLASIGEAQERTLQPLVVSYSSFTGNRAPLWIAKDLGLYEKYGLDVKLVSIAAGSVSLTALLAGNVHLTTDSSSGVVGAVARGAPGSWWAAWTRSSPALRSALRSTRATSRSPSRNGST